MGTLTFRPDAFFKLQCFSYFSILTPRDLNGIDKLHYPSAGSGRRTHVDEASVNGSNVRSAPIHTNGPTPPGFLSMFCRVWRRRNHKQMAYYFVQLIYFYSI